MIRILAILLLILPLPALSQHYINKTKAQIRNEFPKDDSTGVHAGMTMAATDTSISFTSKTGSGLLVYTYIFDKKGKCNLEKIESSCPSCFSSNLQTILDIKKYHWKKINENQYVSDFESKLMIELPTEKNVFAISVLRMDWTRVLYDILMEK